MNSKSIVVAMFTVALGLIAGPAFAIDPGDEVDKLLVQAGLTGGNNTAKILKWVSYDGRITFRMKDKRIIRHVGQKVRARVRCKRSGYRVTGVGKVLNWPGKVTNLVKTDRAKLAKGYKNSIAFKNLYKYCKHAKANGKNGKFKVTLPVTVRGRCTKVKIAIGKKHYYPTAPSKQGKHWVTCR